MTDPSDEQPTSEGSNQSTVKIVVEQASGAVDKANTTMENAKGVLSTIKWVAIAVVALVVLFLGVAVYKIVSAPAKAVGNAAESVGDVVKVGAEKVKDGTSDVINRLVIPAADDANLDQTAEVAFTTLSDMVAIKPEGVKERMLWASRLGGHEGKVCRLDMDFGNGDIPVLIAADNEDYAKAKALGSKDNRLMRIVIRLPDDDVPFNALWDSETSAWMMKWKATTVKKPISDAVAGQRILDILGVVPEKC